MTEQQLDHAIDRAARAMTSLGPRPGLSARVGARLDRREPRRLAMPRVAVAAAIVIAILAAALFLRPTSAPVQQQAQIGESRTPAAPERDRVIPRNTSTVAGRQLHDTAPRIRRSIGRRPAPREVRPFVSTVDVKPLASIAPIGIAPVDTRAIEPPEISIPPLAPIEPVRVNPLPSR